MHRLRSMFPALVFATSLVGCKAPCDRFCEAEADYIEFCLAEASQGAWTQAKGGDEAEDDWAFWAAGNKDEFVAACKADTAAQLEASSTADALEQTCEDEANAYAEHAEHGICAELP